MVFTYFLNDSEMVPVAPIITGITLVFTFHIRCTSIVRLLLLYYYYYYYYYYHHHHHHHHHHHLGLCSTARAMTSSLHEVS
jgi:hypothetical protein